MGAGAGGSPLWFIIWLLILIFISFEVAGFCAFFYIFLYPVTVCIPDLSALTDFLLKGVQFPYYCAKGMMEGQSLF
ncbi:hypothetical protein L9F63_003147 [Diploptera punctata]|uniref:Uncharacterized protein n=1 Tax=Diploptera punctata TaxID=6984 RepID=A0AAD7ZKJ5_DIPPU|nr:hypothetical protein L9F63_003147 [Diploptera punctata]